MDKTNINILVLGVGGNVGQGIIKALRMSELRITIFGACVSAHSAGLYLCDHAFICPLAKHEDFSDWLIDTCNDNKIEGILSGVEEVLEVLALMKVQIEANTSSKVIVAEKAILDLCIDKLQTSRWLAAHQFNTPMTCRGSDTEELQQLIATVGFPLIAKPRRGKGSSGVYILESEHDIKDEYLRDGYLIQEYIGDVDHEYTVSTFSDCGHVVRGLIAFRRKLSSGTTVFAEVVDNADLHTEVTNLVSSLKIIGPCNVQLRLRKGRPVTFEINARFSGTTPIRAGLGFNDVDAAVRHLIIGEKSVDLPVISEGIALRFWQEVIVSPSKIASIISI
jgi:carbamoyl-phosphate synthase large subunit